MVRDLFVIIYIWLLIRRSCHIKTMQHSPDNIDLVIQYTLLVAGEEDNFIDRDLGPIHLIKYVYLADLYYAQRNNGDTFTGVDWKFFNFGPWSAPVHARISPALAAVNADKSTFESKYEDKNDWYRWQLTNDYLLKDKERAIPACIYLHLKRDIHKYLKDTKCLLQYVYTTKPMLHAAPDELLDFSTVVEEPEGNYSGEAKLRMDKLSAKGRKKFHESIAALRNNRNQIKSKDRDPRPPLVRPKFDPEYNDIFNRGVEWLDELAGPAFPEDEFIVEFSDDVWKSAARKGEHVP